MLPDDCLLKHYPVDLPWKNGMPASALETVDRCAERERRRLGGLSHEPARTTAARASRRQADPHRPDRRRQVRLDVPGADPAHARRAPGRHRRPLARRRAPQPRARRLERRADARRSLDAAVKTGATHIGDDWQALVAHPAIDIVVECTGHPIAAVEHCLFAFAHGKHVVNVTVEADAFCGPLLARKAAEAGVVYSLAFGDQPALICDLVDWARTCGFPVVAAGRGHKWLPHFSESTPETVWGNYGLTPEQAQRGGLNPKMFNSFLDGSKPSIESTAVANATGLTVPSNGLLYPPASVEDIPFVTRPISEGGVLERKGMVEVISSLEANGRKIPYDIRMGVWVTVEAETEYIRNCFEEYNAHTDPSGRYFTLYKRWHLIGLEVGMSVASVALRGEATGVATCWNADVVATAKRDLRRARCSTAKAATRSGASCCRPRRRCAWAACRSAWRTTSRSCGR